MKKKNGLPYSVHFDTKEMPGKIVAVRVQLDKVIMGPLDSVRVDLNDHPLYNRLVDYVLNNLPPEKKISKPKEGE